MSVRTVDASQYQKRVQTFDYDMIQTAYGASLSPGNEQNFRWGSAGADVEGSFNYTGTKNPAVDAMIVALLQARDRRAFESAVRALDRVLISGHYVVPLFHLPEQLIAYRARIGHPDANSLYGVTFPTWWANPGQ
jgi:peptide/nickel transport system substrate-binding protein